MAFKIKPNDGVMFFAFFTAVSETTGKVYNGFRICRRDWDEDNQRSVPNKADMIDHVYRQESPYGSGVGAVTITSMSYHHIPTRHNILLNLN